MTTSYTFVTEQRRAAFSLVELLVVILIMTVMVAAIVACISGGVRVWDAAMTFDTVEADSLLALRTLEKEMMRTFRFFEIPFEGDKRQVAFPGMVAKPAGEDSPATAAQDCIGALRYRFDRTTATLVRERVTFPDQLSDSEALLHNVRSLEFAYYRAAADAGGGGEWQARWDDTTNFPARVRIELQVGTRDRSISMQRTLRLAVPDLKGAGE